MFIKKMPFQYFQPIFDFGLCIYVYYDIALYNCYYIAY